MVYILILLLAFMPAMRASDQLGSVNLFTLEEDTIQIIGPASTADLREDYFRQIIESLRDPNTEDLPLPEHMYAWVEQDPNLLLYRTTDHGETLVMAALNNDKPHVASRFLDLATNPEILHALATIGDSAVHTPLKKAILLDDTACFDKLRSAGATLDNSNDDANFRAIIDACFKYDSVQIFASMQDRGVLCTGVASGDYLEKCASNVARDIFDFLIELGVETGECDSNHENILHWLVRVYDEKFDNEPTDRLESWIENLIEINPALLKAPNKNNETPLHIAAQTGNHPLLQRAVSALMTGNDSEINFYLLRDSDGQTVFQVFIKYLLKYPDDNLARMFITNMVTCSPEVLLKKDDKGHTPLSLAIENGREDLVEKLLERRDLYSTPQGQIMLKEAFVLAERLAAAVNWDGQLPQQKTYVVVKQCYDFVITDRSNTSPALRRRSAVAQQGHKRSLDATDASSVQPPEAKNSKVAVVPRPFVSELSESEFLGSRSAFFEVMDKWLKGEQPESFVFPRSVLLHGPACCGKRYQLLSLLNKHQIACAAWNFAGRPINVTQEVLCGMLEKRLQEAPGKLLAMVVSGLRATALQEERANFRLLINAAACRNIVLFFCAHSVDALETGTLSLIQRKEALTYPDQHACSQILKQLFVKRGLESINTDKIVAGCRNLSIMQMQHAVDDAFFYGVPDNIEDAVRNKLEEQAKLVSAEANSSMYK